MSITLQLRPELEAGLQAQASGMSLSEYLTAMVENVLPAQAKLQDGERRAKAYETWASERRETPPLTDEAISREGR